MKQLFSFFCYGETFMEICMADFAFHQNAPCQIKSTGLNIFSLKTLLRYIPGFVANKVQGATTSLKDVRAKIFQHRFFAETLTTVR